MAYIVLNDVSKSYGARSILAGVNLAVEAGEFVSVVGSSASGKSTLLKIASGLVPASSGAAMLGGTPVDGFPRQAAFVFQNYSLLPWFSALENVRLAVEGAYPEWPRKRQTEQAERFLQMVGLGAAMAKTPGQLSGGMRQRVAIARAFAVEPSVLFLDEPFGALDALTRATLQQELAQMCSAVERPVTTLMITNSVDEAILLSDRILTLSRGPGATLSPPVPVSLPRPRNSDLLLHDEAAVRIRARLAEFLIGSSASGAKVRQRGSIASAKTIPVEA